MNRLFLLLCGMVTFVANAQVPDYVPTEGLVGWWPLDGSGIDANGNGINLEAHEITSSANRFEQDGLSTHFNGSTSYLSTNIELDLLELTNTFSIQFWTRAGSTATSEPQCIFYEGIPGEFHFANADPGVDFTMFHWAAKAAGNLWFGPGIEIDNTWFNVVGVHEAGTMTLYIDGEFVGSEFNASCCVNAPNNQMVIGARRITDMIEQPFDGYLDDFGIWNRALTESEILALYNAPAPVPGCTDATACNYDTEATSNDGSCVYPPSESVDCEFGGNYCGEGTTWDASLQACVGFDDCPSDLDGDGVIGVSDLMELLADFGTDCPSPWSCGDPVNYHGYDYATVHIGEQCWFAENLRTEQYQNGDSIPGNLSSSQWTNTDDGAQAVYANDSGNLDLYGRLYNGYAMADARALCPTNWHVPSDEDWGVLELELGMDESELLLIGERGDDQGSQLKASASETPSWDGTNASGFSAVANGYRHNHGYYQHLNFNSHYWTQTASEEGVFYIRTLQNSVDGVIRLTRVANSGYTVRCVTE